MRNPDRIEKVLERIKRVWKKYPDLRLGQLICNLRFPELRLYHIEDEELVGHLERFYGELSK